MAEPDGTGASEWAGQYRLVARIGAGGMGEVYLARTPGGRAVAVKKVYPHLAQDEEFRHRFAREATAAERTVGAFTAPVLDADPEASVPWLATAFVAGPSLTEAIAATGPLPEGSVRTVGAGLAEALLSIHEAGLIHRDLKPDNVLLSASGPRIIDFGLARLGDTTAFTATGQAAGTPGYLPPEVLEGEEAGPAGDVFALGGVLAFAATGRHPYGEGPVVAILRRVVAEPPDVAGVGPDLRELLTACLNVDPGARPGADELLDALGDTGAIGGPAPLPRAVTDLIAARENWAAAQVESVPYEEPPQPSSPEPPERSSPGPTQPDPTQPAARSPRTRSANPGRGRWRASSGRSVVLAAAAVAVLLVSFWATAPFWRTSGAEAEAPEYETDLVPPPQGSDVDVEPSTYTLAFEHELDLPGSEEAWNQSLELSHDGGTAYLKGGTTPVLAVDTNTGDTLHTSEATPLGRITVAPDGETLALHSTRTPPADEEETAETAEPVLVVDAQDGQTITETREGVRGGDTAFTPEGGLVLTNPWGRTGLWDTENGGHLRTIAPTGGQRLAISSDGSLVAFLREATDQEDPDDMPARIEVWTSTGEQVAEIDAAADSRYTGLYFSPGTSQLTAVGLTGAWMWDAATGEGLGAFEHGVGSGEWWGSSGRGVPADSRPQSAVDEAKAQLLVWSHDEPPVAVDLHDRIPLGEVAVAGDSGPMESVTGVVGTSLSSDSGVFAHLTREAAVGGEEQDTYRLHVWHRDIRGD